MTSVTKAAAVLLVASWATALKLQPDQSCPILTLLPFTDLRQGPPDAIQEPGVDYYGFGHWPTPESLGKATFSHMAAAQLAKEHFNNRDTSIVSELANEVYQSCPVTLPDMWFLDSGYNRSLAVDQVLDVHEQALLGEGVEPCGVVGPVEPRVTEGVSVISQNMGIPQLIYQTIDRRLTRTQDFPSLGRTITEARHFAVATAEYLQRDGFARDYVAIIYDFSDYGEQFEDPLEDEEDRLGMETLTEHIVESENESLWSALGEVAADGYHTVVLATERPAFLRSIAKVAEELEILGDEWFWAISAPAVNPHILPTLRAEVDSPLDKLLRGAMVYSDYDHFVYEPEGDKFLQSWQSQGGNLVTKINQMHPLDPSAPEYFAGDQDYFAKTVPAEYASFIYDSMMLIGMSACQLLAKQAAGEPIEEGLGGDHSTEIFNTVFSGASGKVMFDTTSDTPNSRSPNGDGFGIYNVRPGPTESNGERGYKAVLTSLYKENEWVNVEGEEFLFPDGTSNQPMPLATIFDENYLSNGIRILGFVLMGLALFVSLGTWVGVFSLRKVRLMLAAQPIFLYMVCFGSFLVASSIFFASFDEKSGWDESMLSAGCSIVPWFFVLGYLIQYCALYSKLWRINKLLSLRRRMITASQAMWPFAIIISACLIVLITWQVLDPLEWQRDVLEDVEPRATYGECQNEEGSNPYVISLACLIAVATTMTLYIAWQTKGVQEELAEASWIFYAIFLHLQIWVIGLPTFIILDQQSADAAYLIRVFLAFFFAITIPVLVVWPKFYKYYMDSRNGEEPKTPRLTIPTGTDQRGSRVHVSGFSSNGSSRFISAPGEAARTDNGEESFRYSAGASADLSVTEGPVLTAQVSTQARASSTAPGETLVDDSETEHAS